MSAIVGISSMGNVPASKWSPTIGSHSLATNVATVSRIIVSSSDRTSSIS